MAEVISYKEGQYNKVSAIVDHMMFLNTISDQWFQWCLEVALWKLRELRLDIFQDVKSELFPVTDRKTVVLPPGFVDWVKVGTKIGQYLVTVGVNDKLNTLSRDANSNDFVAGLFSQNLPNGLNFDSYGGYYFLNYNGGSVASVGTGFVTKGTFKVHDYGITKEILLDYDYPFENLLVEFITDGFDPCGETVVNPYFADYLNKGMEAEWEEKKNPNRTEASIRRKALDFVDAEKKVRARKNDLDPQTILNISRAQTRFTPHI